VKGIEDMGFRAEPLDDGRFVGHVREFDDLHSKPHRNRLDAIDEIITLTSRRLREIDSSRQPERRS
jgi:hypothetical protein